MADIAKSKQRRSSRGKGKYAAQFNRTDANKARRAKKRESELKRHAGRATALAAVKAAKHAEKRAVARAKKRAAYQAAQAATATILS